MTPRALLLRGADRMHSRDRDVLVAALISGAGLLLAMTGLAWAVTHLVALIHPAKETA